MLHLKQHYRLIRHGFTAPFIYSVFFPFILLDLWIEVYHRISFPLCKIAIVKRSKYLKIDRYKLSYLNVPQKFNCLYCGYINGLVNYWTEILSRTEQYWCGIQHEKGPNFIPPKYHANFTQYNNEKEFRDKYLPTKV